MATVVRYCRYPSSALTLLPCNFDEPTTLTMDSATDASKNLYRVAESTRNVKLIDFFIDARS